MQIGQVAAQLYTLRDYLKNPSDIGASLAKVRKIGYEAVQVSGMGAIAEEELARILNGEGLVLCATHEPTVKILDSPDSVAERLHKLGCRYTAVPSPGDAPLNTEPEVKAFAERLGKAGKALRAAGVTLTYHNHHMEFRRVAGKTILATLYDQTDPQDLQGELDTYWVQYGGGDPVAWCKKLSGRLPLIHLKDYVVDPENKPTYTEIGAGNLDWPEIINSAEDAGCQWFIVEQDTCPGDPFDSLAQSFRYIRENLVKY